MLLTCMKTLILFLLALPTLGCTRSTPVATSQAELDNVARCFHATTTLLQSEPDTPTDLADFLRRGKLKSPNSTSVPVDTDFDALRWNSDGSSLLSSSDEIITCQITKQEHDNYGAEGTARFTEYEFSVPHSDVRAQTTIELSMRR